MSGEKKFWSGKVVVAFGLVACLGACSVENGGASREVESPVAPPVASLAVDEASGRVSESVVSQGFGESAVGSQQVFAVSHKLGIAVAPDWVRVHFLAVKDLCASVASLRCELVGAAASVLRQGGGMSSAYVEVRLPHDAVASFKERAVAPLDGENRDEIEIRRDVTTTSNVSGSVADVSRRMKELEAYRERLEGLAGRAESRVSDLIRIAQELSQVQAQIEEQDGRLRHLGEITAAEKVRVEFEALRPALDATEPVRRVFFEGERLFWRSTAEVLESVLSATPWFLLLAVLASVGVGAVRLIRRH